MKSYLSYFRLRFITNLQYRMEAIAGICTQIFFALIFIMVYLAFYESGGNVPMNWQELVNYLWLQQSFFALIYPFDRENELLDMIKNGKPFGKDYFAVTGKTAAELVYERVNAEKPAMGLTTWKDAPDGKILKRDISVAKNYLNEKELSRLNRLVTMFIDYGELMAEDEVLMSMQDWVEQTNQILRNNRREVLEGKGKVSHDMAMKKAEKEYEIFRVKQDLEYVSEFDREVERYLKGE